MKNKNMLLALLSGVILSMTACANGSNEPKGTDTSSYNASPTGPAPDNSNATNPSLGDTNLIKNDTIHTDSSKH